MQVISDAAQAQSETADPFPMLTKNIGSYQVTVKHSPHPATPNTPLQLQIKVIQTSTAQELTDATIIVNPSMPGMEMPGVVPVTAKLNPVKNSYEAIVPVEMAGLWEFRVAIQSTQFPRTEFTLTDQVERDQLSWILILVITLGLPCLMVLFWVSLLRGLVNELNKAAYV
jgi:hypothetical protein